MLWKSRPRSIWFWLVIAPVLLRHLSVFRNLSLWTVATKALHYTNIFHRRLLASSCYLHFMLGISLRAFLTWTNQNIFPEASFSTASSLSGEKGGRLQLWVSNFIVFGVRGLLTCKAKHRTLRNRGPWHASCFIFLIFMKGILVLPSPSQTVVVKIN